MKQKMIKELVKDEFFTLQPIEEPRENQVWVRGDYERSTKKYSCNKFSDMNHERLFRGDKIVFTDFIF